MKKSIRDAYGDALKEFGAKYEDVIVMDADVSSSTKSGVFGAAYPDRFLNVGIAEANMVAMAAGLSTVGFTPVVNTFATFMVSRAADPLRSLVAYTNLNVKVAGAYAGVSDSYDGATHHALEDIAFFRSLPNFTIISVADAIQAKEALDVALKEKGPMYLRLSRADVPVIYDENYKFELGKGECLREGKDATIIATGVMVAKALEAAEKLKAEGIDVRVVNIHTIKPIDKDIIIESAKQTGKIVVAEEHNIYGGLGSAVAEVVTQYCPVKMAYVGFNDCFTESGDYEELLTKYGLDTNSIIAKVKGLL
ncbi:transketolase [Candidatus Epulonipiscium fishelsonii]|uniref:Transketolase n=1 Tax=Candidatus Epulonipiscium fishelsonii TaxID=77094 RepID=A0ACC8XEV2_9FIRM|nr:transketolase [Epulopiscium sp. SCG-B11WGA-EpuloA1]ONI43133.1 transketolase [Epulopiscium sp. SCG-B05WGA-EpuloA1]